MAEVFDGTHQTPNYVKDGIPFYSVEQITANDFSKTKYVTKDVFDKENKRVKIEKGDILMTRIGDIGTAKYINWEVNASFYVSIVLIKQSLKYNSEYFSHFIGTKIFQNELWNRTIHVAFPKKINLGEISNCLGSFPSLSEQQKIASFLSLIDDLIQTQNKIIQVLESLIKETSKKLFSQQLRFKDDDGSNFPDWKIKRIVDILTIGSGRDYKHLEKGDIPVFGTGGLMTYVNSYFYEGETVCIGRKGTIDKPMYFKGKIWTVDTLFYSHSFLNAVPKFIFYIFKMINWKEYNEASGVPSLSKNTIEKIEINIPSLPEQTKIATFLSQIDEKIEIEKQLLTQYENQKKYLLQNLFI